MDLHELRVAARLIDGLAKRALFAEKQMVALEGQCAEWQRIADDLKAERNALRSTTIDTATGRLLDAFGSLANEPRHGATDDEYRDRIVTKIHTIKLERDALRAQLDTERERHKQTASILAQYAPKTMQIEPPSEATHDTPAGKQAAESAVKREPKPGDVVRLVRVPSEATVGDTLRKALEWPWEQRWGTAGDLGRVLESTGSIPGARSVRILASGMRVWWPLSCVEVVGTEPDEIKVGDMVEVFQATDANWTRADEIGIKGTVQRIKMNGHMIPVVYLSNDGAYALRDVRKVTT